jgi:hypothetical protein
VPVSSMDACRLTTSVSRCWRATASPKLQSGQTAPTLLRERRAALAEGERPRVPARSSVGWSVRPPSRGCVATRVASGACHHGQSAVPVPAATPHGHAQNDSRRATIPGGGARVVPPAASTTSAEPGPPHFAAPSFLRRSTKAVLSRPLSPRGCKVEWSASRLPQRIRSLSGTRRRR